MSIMTSTLTSPNLMNLCEDMMLEDCPVSQLNVEVGATTTTPSLTMTRPSVTRRLVSSMESSASDENVPISLIHQGDEVGGDQLQVTPNETVAEADLLKLMSVESALAAGKSLSSQPKHQLWNQLDILASVARTKRIEPYKKMINEVELHFLELQHLPEADVTAIVEHEFHRLTTECHKLEDTTHNEIEEINQRLQELTIHLAEIDGKNTKITSSIFENEATINGAKAIIAEAQAKLEAAQ
ncbi:uncharacterized protein A4U43_C01F15560 [Asparagus officinalis]|uniref:Uncharacterized protein n=1 Tax=Asparagus officinalis TaxID=4686 RepID=A0A5P1FU61_ASPOF|nr:uncharacterized protein A4U43_C01F15560 [Asparagus officinalis]